MGQQLARVGTRIVTKDAALTPHTVASLVTRDPALIEQIVEALPASEVTLWMVTVDDALGILRKMASALNTRMLLDGRTGEKWSVGDREYGFFGSQPKGFKEIPSLIVNLRAAGISLEDIAEAVSDMRVGSLRTAARALSDPQKVEDTLALLEGHRYAKGDRGTPRLQQLDRVIGGKRASLIEGDQ